MRELIRDVISRTVAIVVSHPLEVISLKMMAQFVGGETKYRYHKQIIYNKSESIILNIIFFINYFLNLFIILIYIFIIAIKIAHYYFVCYHK